MTNEEKIEHLEHRISLLEKSISEITKGNFESITTTRLTLKQKNDDDYYNSDDCGMYIYDRDDNLLYKTIISDRGNVLTIYYDKDHNEITSIGLCEHGASRIALNNISGKEMIFIGTVDNDENHSPVIRAHSQDGTGDFYLFVGDKKNRNGLNEGPRLILDQITSDSSDYNEEHESIILETAKDNSNIEISKTESDGNRSYYKSRWIKKSSDKF